MKHFVIRNAAGTETQIVQALEGHDDWTVVGEHRGDIEDACRFDPASKKLKRCDVTHKRRQRERLMRDPVALLDRIETLEAALAARTSTKET